MRSIWSASEDPGGSTEPQGPPSTPVTLVKRLSVLLIAPQPFFSDRGTPIAVRMAAEAMGAEGHQVDLLTLPHGKDVEMSNVTVHRVREIPGVNGVPIGPSWQKLLYDGRIAWMARLMLRSKEYDVMHGVEEGALIAWGLSQSRYGVPFIYDMDSHLSAQLREKGSFYGRAAGLFERLEAAALRDALGVLAVCPALADVAQEHRARKDVTHLPDTPLNEGESPPPASYMTALSGPRVVYVGNLQVYQGIDLLVEAFALVAQAHPEAHLVVVGGSPDHIQKYEDKVARLIPDGRVTFLGPRPLADLGAVLTASDVLVSPRLQGINTPMKIYSYLESGKPVVATRLSTHTQVLSDEVACLVDPVPESLANGISRLLADPTAAATLGQRGQRFVRREYGAERFRERLREFYLEVGESLYGNSEGEDGDIPQPVS
jgi:glycosyltransferase involved in cell wall biosynthesis